MTMGPNSCYRPLATGGDDDNESLLHGTTTKGVVSAVAAEHRSDGAFRRLKIALLVSLILNAGMLLGGLALRRVMRGPENPIFPQAYYSPAEDVIEYETRVFHEGFGKGRTIYQMAPSPEVDAAWDDLYNFGVSRIPRSSADRLVNATRPIPGDEDHYVVSLDVFHQLHCLNMLRKALHPEYYPDMRHDPNNLDDLHWGHCLESLRQSLMCSADISPLVWQWVDRVKEVRLMGNIVHTCRNYDKIKDWALQRRVLKLDFTEAKG
ncbi:hypothetical protein D9611_000059 [Ephemerocybe angulata]|uniref:Uncharacterized protein n=1 Tax=Ephemerocybe angulata TaxID=980116 RepID=A0A8H5F6P1_9AGAR|nr:hypothetical protein D9611_000059 [Tulosesus angulatus]